ncbi:MAG: dihydropteroate synthase [Actinobacteria bacterium]|nr:dihydropteroate synthase [Actinomycetota bacterium]
MLVMGILNVTPDSFADGGINFDVNTAIARGRQMAAEGANIIDVGGESTRPGADRVTPEEEQARVIPVVKALAEDGFQVSIDTMHAETARLAVQAGATIINDVSGGAADPQMFATVAELKCTYILMHWRGHSKVMNSKAVYGDVVSEVISEVLAQVGKAVLAGVGRERLVIDPGIGFAKDADHNWEILRRLDEFTELGFPVLIGHSRKRFLGGAEPSDREASTVEVTKSLVGRGIWGVRVHGVKANVEAIRS